MHQNLLSFNSGELSPYLAHRTDFAKHSAGAARMENFLPMAYGAFQKRPGTRWLCDALRQRLLLSRATVPVNGVPDTTFGTGNSAVKYALIQGVESVATLQHNDMTTPGYWNVIEVIGTNIIATVSDKARMTVYGPGQDGNGGTDSFPPLYYAGFVVAGATTYFWSSDGNASAPATGVWHCSFRRVSGGVEVAGISRFQDGVATLEMTKSGGDPVAVNWSGATLVTGTLSGAHSTPVCYWKRSSAQQVVDAVNADPAASALVVASLASGNNGTGDAAIACGPVNLASGTVADELGMYCRVGNGLGLWNLYHCSTLWPVVWSAGDTGLSEADIVALVPGFVLTKYDRRSALVPFVAAGGEKYLLHFIPGWLEVLREDGSRAEVVRWLADYAWPADQHPAQVQVVQVNDVAFITHPAHAPMQLSRLGDASWALDWLSFTAAPCLDDNTDRNRTYAVASNPVPATWAGSTTYHENDTCFTSSEWVCWVGHVSGSTTEPGVGSVWRTVWKHRMFEAGDRVTLIGKARTATAWNNNAHRYSAGEIRYGAVYGFDGSVFAVSRRNHVATGFLPDDAGHPGTSDWGIILPWDNSSVMTEVGSFRVPSSSGIDRLYRCIQAHVTEYVGATGTPGTGATWTTYWADMGDIPVDISHRWFLSDPFSPGIVRSHGGNLYRCLVTHDPAEAMWEPGVGAHWQGVWELLYDFTAGTSMGLRGPGQYYKICPERETTESQVEIKALAVNAGLFSPQIIVQGGWDFFTFGTWHGSFILQRSLDGGATWATTRTWQASGDRNVAEAGTEDFPTFLRIGFIGEAGTESSGEQRGVLIPRLPQVTGYALLNEYVSATEMRGVAATSILSGSTWRWAEGAFSDANGFPKSVCLHERRLFLASSLANPISVWGSASDDMNHFETGTKDSDGIFVTLAASAAEPIRWMASQRSLFLGTPASEWTCGSDPAYMAYTAPAALTPTNFQCRQYTAYGSSTLQPIKVGPSLVFAGRNGAALWELSFSSNGQAGGDLSRYAEHLTAKGIVSMARQSVRTAGIWAVTEDGTVLNLVHDTGEELLAWSRHTTQGGAFKAVAVIPSDNGDDGVFFLVERGNVTTLEAIPQDWQAAREDGTPDPVLDCMGGPVWSDLPVTSTLTLLPLDVQDPATGQPTAARVKRANEMVLNLLASQGGGVVYDGTECALDYPGENPFTGWLRVTLSPAHVFDLQPSIVHATADPFTCLAAVVRWTPHEP
ncbi:MAG: hypothetical protein WCK77_14135 [Verrucomicrobiota bacterium]